MQLLRGMENRWKIKADRQLLSGYICLEMHKPVKSAERLIDLQGLWTWFHRMQQGHDKAGEKKGFASCYLVFHMQERSVLFLFDLEV